MGREGLTPALEKQAVANMEALRANEYPGRGIVMGFSGRRAIQIYWIMGRSENSRNRIFVAEGATVRTAPFDASKVKDPSLIIYTAMRSLYSTQHIVSNGDQTDTIAEFLGRSKSFRDALETRTYEPDAPNFTPRISGLIDLRGFYTPAATLSVIKRDETTGAPKRSLHDVSSIPGLGFCVQTYKGNAPDGNPLPSFQGSPHPVLLEGPIDRIAQTYWGLLNPENAVALAVKSIDQATLEVETRVINKLTPK